MSDDSMAEAEPGDGFVPAFAEAPVGAALGSLAAAMSAVGSAAIGFLMLLIVADVVGRNFLNAPITGVAEVAAHTVVAIVFLQVAAAILQGRLTRADFLLRRIGTAAPRAAALLDLLFCLVGAVVFALVVWASWPKLMDSWRMAEFFGVQGVFTIPTWPFRGIILVGSATAVLAALYRATDEARRLAGRAPEGRA